MSSSQFVKSILGKQEAIQETSVYVSKNEDWKFSVARLMLSGIIKNQYYKSADESAKEALPLLIAAAKKDPGYVLKAACFARDSNMKGFLKIGLACVAGQSTDEFLNREDVRNCAIALLATFHPGQLLQFVELMKSKACGRGFGARPQKWVATVMQDWTNDKIEEYTLKYPTAFNALLRLVHPALDTAQGNLARYVLTSVKGNLKNGTAFGKLQKAVEKLKTDPNSTDVANAIVDLEIPWDVIKGFAKMDKKVATAMMTTMGLSGLLLNLKSLDEHDVFKTKDGLEALRLKMNEVKNGRSIPIDFAKPYVHCANPKVKEILLDAMADVLSVPMPALEGRSVGVSVDISGSMNGETLQTAGLLSVPFIKAKNLWFTCFNTKLWEEAMTNHRNLECPKINGIEAKDQIKNLLSLQANGGTDVAISLRVATQNKRKLDLMVIVTDEAQNAGTPLMTAWNQYKKAVNPRAELWIVNATNYEWHSADFSDPSVTVYQSMSSAMFKNLQFLGQDLVSAIEGYAFKTYKRNVKEELDKPAKKAYTGSSKFVKNVTKSVSLKKEKV